MQSTYRISPSATLRGSLAPLIQPRPPTGLCQSVLVLWTQPHVFFPEHQQHLLQRSLQSLRCNLLCFPSTVVPHCATVLRFFWSWGEPASVHFDCNQRSISGFLSHLDSLDWYIDSYLSRGSFWWGCGGVWDWWVYKTLWPSAFCMWFRKKRCFHFYTDLLSCEANLWQICMSLCDRLKDSSSHTQQLTTQVDGDKPNK